MRDILVTPNRYYATIEEHNVNFLKVKIRSKKRVMISLLMIGSVIIEWLENASYGMGKKNFYKVLIPSWRVKRTKICN